MRRRKRIFWKLFPGSVATLLAAVLAVIWYSSATVQRYHFRETEDYLTGLARLLALQIARAPDLVSAASADPYCKEAGRSADARVTIILNSGKVIGDSSEDPARMGNHADRPEIQAAQRGQTAQRTRYSSTLRAHMMYLATPIVVDHCVIGVVRTSRKLTRIRDEIAFMQWRIGLVGVVVAAAAGALTFWFARRLVQPIEAMRRGAERFAAGDLDFRLPEPDTLELAELGHALNQMAAKLAVRIKTVTEQRNESEAILRSMWEGVLAVDREERVITVNEAAVSMLGLQPPDLPGRTMQEAIRNPTLQKIFAAALRTEERVSEEFVLYGQERERIIRVHGAALHDAAGERMGAVIVLDDMTELRRLESLGKQFVANVSHELRTPLTTLQGFVETLLDGAVEEPENARRFLAIIADHAARLKAIVEDLLLLSRVEKDEESGNVALAAHPVSDIICSALQSCESLANDKNITLRMDCAPDLVVTVNAQLMEQALINLVDNAIKHSPGGSTVAVAAQQQGDSTVIEVKDQGCGIPRAELTRVFERFYRIDKGRSRELGGTGLGLAIVKHIVHVHRGSVEVSSEVGKGTVITLRLPLFVASRPVS